MLIIEEVDQNSSNFSQNPGKQEESEVYKVLKEREKVHQHRILYLATSSFKSEGEIFFQTKRVVCPQ